MRKVISVIAALFTLKGAMAGQELGSTSKQVSYRGGLVEFSLPHSWVKEYEPEGGGVFYAPGDNTGTLRLDVITAKSPTPVSSFASGRVLSDIGHPNAENLSTGSALAKSISRVDDRGVPITIYWWYVANVVEPDQIRIASFSYSILRSEEQSTRTTSDLAFLEQAIRGLSFGRMLAK